MRALVLPALLLTASACGPSDVEAVEDSQATDLTVEAGTEGAERARYWATYDRDNDGALDATEFANGLHNEAWWRRVDLDEDSVLSEDEFTAAYADQPWFRDGLYADWNTDGYDGLTSSEFGVGVFETWDADDSGTLTEDEAETGFFV